jgi:hypothetical protein
MSHVEDGVSVALAGSGGGATTVAGNATPRDLDEALSAFSKLLQEKCRNSLPKLIGVNVNTYLGLRISGGIPLELKDPMKKDLVEIIDALWAVDNTDAAAVVEGLFTFMENVIAFRDKWRKEGLEKGRADAVSTAKKSASNRSSNWNDTMRKMPAYVYEYAMKIYRAYSDRRMGSSSSFKKLRELLATPVMPYYNVNGADQMIDMPDQDRVNAVLCKPVDEWHKREKALFLRLAGVHVPSLDTVHAVTALADKVITDLGLEDGLRHVAETAKACGGYPKKTPRRNATASRGTKRAAPSADDEGTVVVVGSGGVATVVPPAPQFNPAAPPGLEAPLRQPEGVETTTVDGFVIQASAAAFPTGVARVNEEEDPPLFKRRAQAGAARQQGAGPSAA